jgi:hypothetical protein
MIKGQAQRTAFVQARSNGRDDMGTGSKQLAGNHPGLGRVNGWHGVRVWDLWKSACIAGGLFGMIRG